MSTFDDLMADLPYDVADREEQARRMEASGWMKVPRKFVPPKDRSPEHRVAARLAEYVRADSLMTWGALRRKTASRDRPLLERAVSFALVCGWMVERDNGFTPGPNRPA